MPRTILRATQFHTLVARTFEKSARLGIVPLVERAVATRRPGSRSAGRWRTPPSPSPPLAITQFAGPEVVSVRELARRWRAGDRFARRPAAGSPRLRSLRAGGLTNPGAWRGTVTFDAVIAA